MSTTLSAQQQHEAVGSSTSYTNEPQNRLQVALSNAMPRTSRHTQFSPRSAQSYTNNAFEDYGSFSPYSTNPYEGSFYTTHTNNGFFPTPPLSSNVPNFFDNSGLTAHNPAQRSAHTPQRLQFGSDARFVGHNFVAPPEQETEETLLKRKMNHLECLRPEESPASTHPSSPILQKKKNPSTGPSIAHYQSPTLPAPQQTHQNTDPPETPEPKARKRRKADSDSDFEESAQHARKGSKKTQTPAKKSKTPVKKASNSRENSVSKTHARPSNRRHLTEEQKKTNHIISEQKRRDLIAQGYEGLRRLVPSLRDDKVSKGQMLESAADWLQDILETNQALKAQLQSLKGQ